MRRDKQTMAELTLHDETLGVRFVSSGKTEFEAPAMTARRPTGEHDA